MGETRSVEAVELGKHFSEEELTTVARLIYGNKGLPEEEVDQVAEMLSTGVIVGDRSLHAHDVGVVVAGADDAGGEAAGADRGGGTGVGGCVSA